MMIKQWHVKFNFHFSVAGMHYVSATQPGLWTCHDFQRDGLTPLPVRSRRKRKWWHRINFIGGNGNGLNAGFRYRPGWRPGLLVWYGVSKLNDATMISSKMNMMISQKKRDCLTAPATTTTGYTEWTGLRPFVWQKRSKLARSNENGWDRGSDLKSTHLFN